MHVVPDSKVYGASMGPSWGRQDPGGPHIDPINLAIWGVPLSSPIATAQVRQGYFIS